MTHIDFEAKTDRELLILAVQQGNETVDHLAKLNNKIAKQEQRITDLERAIGKGWKSTLRLNWQTLSLLASIIALILVELAPRIGI